MSSTVNLAEIQEGQRYQNTETEVLIVEVVKKECEGRVLFCKAYINNGSSLGYAGEVRITGKEFGDKYRRAYLGNKLSTDKKTA